ncbi:GtrA family protein [Acidocella sp. KAb 2-4]|uniref:GtrA family protein n=1 Tax=Acidocella sp. KAb 2-4 TaxID=2885158 RepID=UPI001D065DDA|nr:GtrA family protein [Acidocella sp. KAb 2-4]MCB5943559.1 GtrA family protein [Acidocella sp. KAb 2-4]
MRAETLRLLSWLDALVALLARLGLPESFIRFGIVGVLGFCWDTGTVYLLRGHTNLYVAGTCGFLVAATANWAANRLWTFRHHDHAAPHVQWAKFIAANAIGFVFNRGVFFTLVARFTLVDQQPVIGIIAGTCAGLVFNYLLSKRFVFR